jgi:CHAT domain-containing protein
MRISIQSALLLFYLFFCLTESVASPDQRRIRLENTYNEYVNSGKFLENYDQATQYLSGIVKEGEMSGYWDLCLGALSLLAYIHDANFHHDRMKQAIELGSGIMKKNSVALDSLDPKYFIRVEMSVMIGSYYVKNCDFRKAEEVFLSLIDKLNSLKNPDKSAVFKSYAYLADLYIDMGLYDQVDSYYHLMLKSVPEGDLHDLYSYTQELYLASSLFRNKNYGQAKIYLTDALEYIPVLITENWKKYVISNYKLLASVYQTMNKPDSASLYLNKCLKLLGKDDPLRLDVYEIFGEGLMQSGDYSGALEYFHRIEINIYRETLFNTSRKAQILSRIAECYLRKGDARKSIEICQNAFIALYKDSSLFHSYSKNPDISIIHPDKISIGLLITKSNALYEYARKNNKSIPAYENTLASYQLATAVIGKFRHLIKADDYKEFFVMEVRNMYENAIKACYELYDINHSESVAALAYTFMERSKNQVLLDAIHENQARKFGDIPDSLIEKEYHFKNQLVKMQNDFYELNFDNADPEIIRNCQFESARIQKDYAGFLKMLEKRFPEYYQVKYSDKIPGLQEIKKYASRKILIEYLDGENSIALIAFNRHKTVFKVFPKSEEFIRSLDRVLQALTNSDDLNRYDQANYKQFVNQSFYLYEKLVKPAISQFLPAKELILIPDGKLSYLPFEVLISKFPENLSEVNYEKLNYLLLDFTIRYEYSAGLLDFQRKNAITGERTVYSGFAPFYGENSALNKVRVLGRRPGFLSGLKYNMEEVEGSSEIFKGKAYLGTDATKSNFINSISSKIIHFAGHTIINDSIPELSGMFFSGRDDAKESNEVLYLDEMFNLAMSADLAILSGCETGFGRLLKGEGLSSIGRAFKYAGCNDLVMTLWKINDHSASLLIKKFCQNLRRGLPTAAALRKAKIDCLKNTGPGRPANPFYWSAFIMIGSNEPLFHKNDIWLIVFAFVIAFLLTFFILRSHQRNS